MEAIYGYGNGDGFCSSPTTGQGFGVGSGSGHGSLGSDGKGTGEGFVGNNLSFNISIDENMPVIIETMPLTNTKQASSGIITLGTR